jgi:hypothetical protein
MLLNTYSSYQRASNWDYHDENYEYSTEQGIYKNLAIEFDEE